MYLFFFYFFIIGQSGGASRWRVCNQRGLPRLVSQRMTELMNQLMSDKRVCRTATATPGLLKLDGVGPR